MTTCTSHPVLVGVDNTASSQPALDMAAAEAAARKLPLRLVCLHPPSAARAPSAHRAAAHDRRLLAERARRQVAHAYPDLPISTTVAAGDPTEVMLDQARRAELVVVGHQRHPGTGGVAAAVAARADCPVIVIPAGARGGPRWAAQPVVVGIKSSDRDAPAVAFGLAEAALRDVPLRAVHVWLNIPDMELASVDPFVYDLAEARRDADRLIQAALRGWTAKYPQVTVERAPLYQVDVADTLTDASAHAGLLVLGPPGHNRHRIRLGPVSQALIDCTHCPLVLTR